MRAPTGSGLYALVDLSGAPVSPRETRVLGLTGAERAIAACGIDRARPDAVSLCDDGARLTLLVGHLTDVPGLAARLKLPSATPPAALARAALDRFGDAIASEMGGEWSLLDWGAGGELALATSFFLRDPLYYMRYGSRIAIAPRIDMLRGLGWTNQSIDPAGLLFTIGRGALRRSNDTLTLLPGARSVPAGVRKCLTIDGEITGKPAVALRQTAWEGSFAEAMEEVDRLLRQIVREQISDGAPIACMVSGGLDSTIIAMLAAEERQPGQPLLLLSSAAHPDLPAEDEMRFARMVGDALALPVEPIAAPPAKSAYRPSIEQIESANRPVIAPYHYLFDMFEDRAASFGSSVLMTGQHGEASVSTWPADRSLRAWAARKLGRRRIETILEMPFPVRLAAHQRAALPAEVLEAMAHADDHDIVRNETARRRFNVGSVSMELPGERIRASRPFLDRRLLDLFARFPKSFATYGGLGRSPARHLLAGKMPDAIRLRQGGGAFSPDYRLRLHRQAPEALERLPVFRRTGVDEWLDLDWLESGLRRFAAQPPRTSLIAFEVQLTAMVAEYLAWWNDPS